MSYSHHAWAQRNLDAWLDKYDAASEGPDGLLEHERPAPAADLATVRIRRAHDRIAGYTRQQAAERHPALEAA